jgi:uncharacterized membrane protein YebE (DUF533 family)
MHALTQMKLLVNLAQADGEIASRERNYILNIGKANGLPEDQIQTLLQQQHPVIVPDNLTNDEKFNCIYTLVQLMKIDERMYQEEIRFCSTIAVKLGYDQEVLFELMLHVKTYDMDEKEIKRLKEVTAGYLKKK